MVLYRKQFYQFLNGVVWNWFSKNKIDCQRNFERYEYLTCAETVQVQKS